MDPAADAMLALAQRTGSAGARWGAQLVRALCLLALVAIAIGLFVRWYSHALVGIPLASGSNIYDTPGAQVTTSGRVLVPQLPTAGLSAVAAAARQRHAEQRWRIRASRCQRRARWQVPTNSRCQTVVNEYALFLHDWGMGWVRNS